MVKIENPKVFKLIFVKFVIYKKKCGKTFRDVQKYFTYQKNLSLKKT